MSPESPAQPLPSVLLGAQIAYEIVLKAQALSVEGREKEAALAWSGLCRFVERELPVLKGVIATQAEAANAEKLAKTEVPLRIIAAIGARPAAPHPHAANAHPTDPIQPTAEA